MFKFPRAQKRIKNKKQTAYVEKGVSITPMPVTMDETVMITYDGLLAQSNAQTIYAHVGNGFSDYWEDIQDIPMKKESNTWTASITPLRFTPEFLFPRWCR
ncbi:MAG: carbohydrate-binding protein [Peptococcia bacterium]